MRQYLDHHLSALALPGTCKAVALPAESAFYSEETALRLLEIEGALPSPFQGKGPGVRVDHVDQIPVPW